MIDFISLILPFLEGEDTYDNCVNRILDEMNKIIESIIKEVLKNE